mmetsp:Transcript_53065/g.166710  ORF Transcript_53065/g.166710 Transcript_53065/m.166710 type:complete len:88 (+) Transcript_53065:340-603(+)
MEAGGRRHEALSEEEWLRRPEEDRPRRLFPFLPRRLASSRSLFLPPPLASDLDLERSRAFRPFSAARLRLLLLLWPFLPRLPSRLSP